MTLTINWSSQDNSGKPQYSDHAPIRNANILSWNIMNQCMRSLERTNNGFGVTETDNDYKSRLTRLATAIASAVEQYSIDIIALQEAPNKSSRHFSYFIGQLKQKLGRDFVIESQYADDTPQTSSSRLTIFNGKKLQAKNVTNSHTLKLGQQNNRIQITEFVAGSSKPFLFANAHFAFGAESRLAIYTLLSQDVILAGDLNGDVNSYLASRPEPVNRVAGANFSFDVLNNRRNTQTSYDAIVTPQHYQPVPQATNPYAIYVRETLSPEMAAHYCRYQPSAKKRMGELIFRNQAAANAILAVLKLENIVTNPNKHTFTNARGEFTIPLGEGESTRLKQQAARLVPIVKPKVEVKKTVPVKSRVVLAPRKRNLVKPTLTPKPKPIIPAKNLKNVTNTNEADIPQDVVETAVVQAEPSYRRRLFQWLGHDNIAFIRHPLMLTAAVAGLGMFYAMGFALTAIVATSVSYAALYTFSWFSATVNEQAVLLKAKPAVWKSNNQACYELGEKSAHWAPYLQSFVQPRAFSSAYQVGLMTAQEETASKNRSVQKR